MDRTSTTWIEKQTLKEYADRMMAKWIALREDLKILALSLYPDYNTKEARELLARDEISMLRTFFEKDDGPDPESVDHEQADHIIALAHGLFEVAGGKESAFWDHFNKDYSAFKNQSICGFMVDATGMNSLEEAHAEQLYHAILKSKLLPRNKTLSFTMFLESVQKCQNVINPDWHQRAFKGDRAA
ncbi:hypothetical protein FBEOM_10578 [Fusarium beomiforme]|uniref:Uncharacterized protein n=1 Tax=Fusarium beomiforme TaxID=44412 RepID=A0A9P5AB89_9HYPO|nr:hypothetical protein FBEOM_10578 [Fusarium beomiforme]